MPVFTGLKTQACKTYIPLAADGFLESLTFEWHSGDRDSSRETTSVNKNGKKLIEYLLLGSEHQQTGEQKVNKCDFWEKKKLELGK